MTLIRRPRLLVASAAGDANTRADGEIKVWEAQTGQEVFTLGSHVSWISDVAFTPDGRRLASAGFDRNVKIWDLATAHESLTLRGHEGAVAPMLGRGWCGFNSDGHPAPIRKRCGSMWRISARCFGLPTEPALTKGMNDAS